MAAVDVLPVVALTTKAVTLEIRGQFARAAEIYAEAVAAAQALQQPDCVIVAHLQASHAIALFGHAQTAGVPAARRVELRRSALLELLPAAMASLERRLTAGALLAGACRPYEVAWCAAKIVHDETLAANMSHAAGRVPSTAEEISASSALATTHTFSLRRLRCCFFQLPRTCAARKRSTCQKRLRLRAACLWSARST
jgi:hypothetical protein